jgi:hypothetical protein
MGIGFCRSHRSLLCRVQATPISERRLSMTSRFKRLLVAITALGVTGVYGAVASASEHTRPVNNGLRALHVDADTVSGCLQKGTKSGEFVLATTGGKEYQLTSQSVPLGKHVGHMVSVTGTAGGTSAGMTPGDTANKAGGGMSMGSQALNVTKLSMVSATCK